MSIFDILGKGKSFRRKSQRKKAKLQVRIFPLKVKRTKDWTQSEYAGISVDLSPHGILLISSAPIEKKDLLRLIFSLSSASKQLDLQARVKTIRSAETGKQAVGFEFVDTSPETQRYLATMLTLYKP